MRVLLSTYDSRGGIEPLAALAVQLRALGAEALNEWSVPSYDAVFGPALSAHRAAHGLPPAGSVRDDAFGGRPWLAADPVLAPWPEPDDGRVVQTGA
jgi:vancomycin aglycone glucosyltransferase